MADDDLYQAGALSFASNAEIDDAVAALDLEIKMAMRDAMLTREKIPYDDSAVDAQIGTLGADAWRLSCDGKHGRW